MMTSSLITVVDNSNLSVPIPDFAKAPPRAQNRPARDAIEVAIYTAVTPTQNQFLIILDSVGENVEEKG